MTRRIVFDDSAINSADGTLDPEVREHLANTCHATVPPYWNRILQCTSETCHRSLPCVVHAPVHIQISAFAIISGEAVWAVPYWRGKVMTQWHSNYLDVWWYE